MTMMEAFNDDPKVVETLSDEVMFEEP